MKIVKKMAPVLVALILIVVISGVFIVPELIQRFTYSDDKYNLNEYFQIFEEKDVPLILQNEILGENARKEFGTYYLSLDTIKEHFTKRFYVNKTERVICFTLPDRVVKAEIGEEVNHYYMGEESVNTPYPIAYEKEDMVYVAIDFVKMFVNFSYECYENPLRIQVYTQWQEQTVAQIKGDSFVRYRGGVKSPILTPVQKDDVVVILEEMEDWDKVKTKDGFVGYIEKKELGTQYTETPEPVNDCIVTEYTSKQFPEKINMAFHHVFSENTGSLLKKDLANAKNVNIVAPTWFRIADAGGNIQSIANSDYVKTAHEMGISVWAVLTDVDEISYNVDLEALFCSSLNRQELIRQVIEECLNYGIDGINIDIERIQVETGIHFVQFLRELSIETRKNDLYLSVDNYVPVGNTNFYNREEQGIVCDYVLIMGYDEHWAGAKEAGSVASIGYVTNGIENTISSVPAQKVINAIPLYTRIWCTQNGEVSSETVGMQVALDWVTKVQTTASWDEETCQNYASYESGDKHYETWLEDTDSIRAKLEVMNSYGIAGVAEWKLGFDTPEVWDVISAYLGK